MGSISQTSSGAAIEGLLAAKQSATLSQVAYAVAGKTLDAQRSAGDAALALLDAAAPQGAAEGKGANFDAVS